MEKLDHYKNALAQLLVNATMREAALMARITELEAALSESTRNNQGPNGAVIGLGDGV